MSHSTAARLLKEFSSESKDPNPAVRNLSPVNEENLFTWRGWLRGIPGTSFEGGFIVS
jgi:ubiquitin-protein ligase